MTTWAARIDGYFGLTALGTTVRREALAGATTFLTMSYIVFVNPSILADAGMPFEAVTAATCLAAAFGSLLMGLWAKHPIALAPGMGINAYFAYAVVGEMGVEWRTALGAVFLSGAAFLVLTAVGFRQKLLEALPPELYAGTAGGIGLFLALIGLRNSGLIVPSETTMVALGDLSEPGVLLTAAAIPVIAAMMARGMPGAILIGIVATTLLGAAIGVTEWKPWQSDWSHMGAAAFEFDLVGALELGLLEIIFVFLFVDLFDTLGAVIAVAKKAGLLDQQGRIPRINRVLGADAAATVVGAVCGTSTVTSFVESSAGVAAGGRSGLTAVVAGLLFLLALPLAPLVGAVPPEATAPALIIVGALVMSAVSEIDWEDAARAVPGFLILITIPLTYSIANGLAIGCIVYDAIRILSGKARATPWPVHALTALFLLRFGYLAAK